MPFHGQLKAALVRTRPLGRRGPHRTGVQRGDSTLFLDRSNDRQQEVQDPQVDGLNHDIYHRSAPHAASAAALRKAIGYQHGAVDRTEMTRQLATLRTHLDPGTFEAPWTAGQVLPLEEVLAEARGIAHAAQATPPPQSAPTRTSYPADLTAREVEVLRLVAHGQTNPQIAECLCISPRTVHAHLHSIYGKLAVTTRSAATRFAVVHGLV